MQDIFKLFSMSVYLNKQIDEKDEKMSNAHAAIVSLYPHNIADINAIIP